MSDRTPPLEGMVYQTVDHMDTYDAISGRFDTPDPAEAQVTTSRIAGADGLDTGKHKVVIDLDLPAQLIPSSTPGHFHLYIDKEMTWDQYRRLLHGLMVAGIIEKGYFNASDEREYTAVRLPWVKKDSAPEPTEESESMKELDRILEGIV